jgi:hypothetical protein
MILPAQGFGDQPIGANLNLADFFENFGRDHEEVPISNLKSYGTGNSSKIF